MRKVHMRALQLDLVAPSVVVPASCGVVDPGSWYIPYTEPSPAEAFLELSIKAGMPSTTSLTPHLSTPDRNRI
ncbi:hypothetical protein M8818_005602 [Zalaria obscura]|uniref:Uncharacterized protein n=1 Tax=Zalaria obscura TaxID=2024903 RepID=A0ACC3S908_9PEZI